MERTTQAAARSRTSHRGAARRLARRSLLARAREWTIGGVLFVAIPAAGCLSTADAQGVMEEIRTVDSQIAALEEDDRDGTPLDAAQRAELQQLYSQREYLYAYRTTFGEDTGPGQTATWISRLLAGDMRAIGEAVGAVVAAETGRRVYKRRKKQHALEADPAQPTTQPIEPTPSVEATNGETLAELTAALLDAKKTGPPHA